MTTLIQRAVTLLALAFFVMVAFQAYELVREYRNLASSEAGQQVPLEQALQIRQQTEALAADTASLADKGNADAKQVVEAMQRQGITLHSPPAPGAASPKP